MVGVNLSAREFRRSEFLAEVDAALGDTGLHPHQLELEITETTAFGDGPLTRDTLPALQTRGVRVPLDDFGTGASSLTNLRDLAVNTLKIDHSFIAGLPDDRSCQAIVRAVTILAHQLGLSVTAEGVETAEQVAVLRRLGVDRGQGFYFAPPTPGDEIRAFLTQTGRRRGP